MELSDGEVIGIILERTEGSMIKSLINGNIDINTGQLLIIQDNDKISLARVEGYEYLNEFYDERGEIARAIIRDNVYLHEILNTNTVIKANLNIIKKYNHSLNPRPGALVRRLPEYYAQETLLLKLYELKSLDGFVSYGVLVGSKIPLLLDLNSVSMHVGIFGETGSGKSYNTRYLVYLLSNISFNSKVTALPMIIIDANGDYVDLVYNNRHLVNRGRRYIKRFVLRSQSTRLLENDVRLTIDLSLFSPRDIAEFILSLKYGEVSNASLQLNLLEYVLNGKDPKEYNYILGTENGITSLQNEIIELVRENRELGFTYSTARAVNSALEIFKNKIIKKLNLISYNSSFNENFLDFLWNNRGLIVIDFSADGSPGIDIVVKQFVVSYITKTLFNYLTTNKYLGLQKYIALIIEEAQNYIPSKDYPILTNLAKEPLVTLATQGRKFGACLFLVSQRPAFIDKYVLSMLNTLFFHRMYHEDIKYVLSATGGLSESLARSLSNLETGYVVVTGVMNALRSPVLVKIPWIHDLGNYTGAVERVEKVLISD